MKYYLFIKTYLGTLLPYPSDGIIKENDIDKEQFNKMYEKMPYDKLESKKDFINSSSFLPLKNTCLCRNNKDYNDIRNNM